MRDRATWRKGLGFCIFLRWLTRIGAVAFSSEGDIYTGESVSLESNSVYYSSVYKLAKSVDKNVPGGQPSYYDMISDSVSSSRVYKISSFPLWPSHSYLLNCDGCELGMGLSSAIKKNLGVKDREGTEGTVAVIVRTHNRRMGGLKTGTLSEVVEEVRAKRSEGTS